MSKIKDFRIKRGWTLSELGKRLNVAGNTVWRWEAGLSSPSVDSYRTMASVFECKVDDLFDENPPRSSESTASKTPVVEESFE